MFHRALVITAVVIVGLLALLLLSPLVRRDAHTPGCGCLTLVALLAAAAIFLAFKF